MRRSRQSVPANFGRSSDATGYRTYREDDENAMDRGVFRDIDMTIARSSDVASCRVFREVDSGANDIYGFSSPMSARGRIRPNNTASFVHTQLPPVHFHPIIESALPRRKREGITLSPTVHTEKIINYAATPSLWDVLGGWAEILCTLWFKCWPMLLVGFPVFQLRYCLGRPLLVGASLLLGAYGLWVSLFKVLPTTAAVPEKKEEAKTTVTKPGPPIRRRDLPMFNTFAQDVNGDANHLDRISSASAPAIGYCSTTTPLPKFSSPVGCFANPFNDDFLEKPLPSSILPTTATNAATQQLTEEGTLRGTLRQLLLEIIKTVSLDKLISAKLQSIGLNYSVQHPMLYTITCDDDSNTRTLNVYDRCHPILQQLQTSDPWLYRLLKQRKRLESLILFPEPVDRNAILGRIAAWVSDDFDSVYDPLNPITRLPRVSDADLLFRILCTWARLRAPVLKADTHGAGLYFTDYYNSGGTGSTSPISIRLVGGLPCNEDSTIHLVLEETVSQHLLIASDRRNVLLYAFAAFFSKVEERLGKPSLLLEGSIN